MENIHYLKDSGVYVYNNKIFGNSSIVDKYTLHIDELNIIINERPPKFNNKIKIGLYHGSVDNARNNFNFFNA